MHRQNQPITFGPWGRTAGVPPPARDSAAIKLVSHSQLVANQNFQASNTSTALLMTVLYLPPTLGSLFECENERTNART